MPDSRDARRLLEVPATAECLAPAPDCRQASTFEGCSDEQIVAGLHQGHPWAADALYERVHDAVRQTLRRIVGPSDSELTDLVHSVFERLIVALSEGRLERVTKLRAWATAVATHLAVDALRARVRRRRLYFFGEARPEEELTGAPSLERSLEARAELTHLRQVLARMPAKRVETLLLHDVLGYSLEETAALTHSSCSATQSRLSRCRRDLARRLNFKRKSGESR